MYTFRGSIFARSFPELMRAFIDLNTVPTDAIRGMTTRRAQLDIRGEKMPLFTIEDEEGSWPECSCKHCRVANCDTTLFPVKRLHVIIPLQDQWNDPLNDTILDHPEDNSLLYAVIHANAFAHLLWVQRSETGLMSGRDFMDLWETIAKNIQIRGVTLEDRSTKYGADLPVLYGLTEVKSWFSRWGYQFWKGSFGTNEVKYQVALAYLRNLNINRTVNLFEEDDRIALQTIVWRYETLSLEPIHNLGQLLQFILTYLDKRRLYTESVSMSSIPRKRWTKKQVDAVLSVLLRRVNTRGRNPVRKEDLLHEATSMNLSRDLSNHVLSSVKNLRFGESRVVICRGNVEYLLEVIPRPTNQVLHCSQDAAIVYDIFFRRYPETSREYPNIIMAKNAVANYKYLMKGATPKSTEDPLKPLNCKCGAREDDGENLVRCNMCGLHVHLICNELESEGVFVCGCCLVEEDEKRMVSEAEVKSKRELEAVADDEVYQE